MSAASNDHPSKPMSVVEKIFRADSSRGVIRNKVNNHLSNTERTVNFIIMSAPAPIMHKIVNIYTTLGKWRDYTQISWSEA